MKRFKDKRTLEVFQTRFAKGLLSHVSIEAHELIRVLVAAHAMEDVGVLGSVFRWKNVRERLGLHVHGKWYVTFTWSDEFGAHDICLQRR